MRQTLLGGCISSSTAVKNAARCGTRRTTPSKLRGACETRNQFFTPSYVVDFLVQNSLGRRLLDSAPDSSLAEDLPLLVNRTAFTGRPIDLKEVRVLDPACGSGHFLLGAFDLLERAWELQGVSAEQAAPHIVSALWGIQHRFAVRSSGVCRNRDAGAPTLQESRDAEAKRFNCKGPARTVQWLGLRIIGASSERSRFCVTR